MRSVILSAAVLLGSCSSPADYPEQPSQAGLAGDGRLSAAFVENSIRQVCIERYAADMAMRAACKRNAEAGVGSFHEVAREFADDADMQASLVHCLDRYTTNGATNFQMAGACARNQRKGFSDFNS